MRRYHNFYLIFPLIVLVFFISCNDDPENEILIEEDTATIPDPDVIPPTPTEGSAERQVAKSLYETYYVASRTEDSDPSWTGNINDCNAGSIPQATLQKILTRIAYYRAVVGLTNEIATNSSKNNKAQAAALIMDANNQLDHNPPSTWSCFTTDGQEGAGNSLLALSGNAEAIDAYIQDAGSANGPVGHRRWLLFPRLVEIGVGNTGGANAIWILGNYGTTPEDAPEFIAWPTKGYTPNNLVFPRWSFSVTGADFSSASVEMEDSNGNPVSLTLEEINNAYGDRTIVWVPNNIVTGTNDTAYTVRITGVLINGTATDYEYEAILFDPDQ